MKTGWCGYTPWEPPSSNNNIKIIKKPQTDPDAPHPMWEPFIAIAEALRREEEQEEKQKQEEKKKQKEREKEKKKEEPASIPEIKPQNSYSGRSIYSSRPKENPFQSWIMSPTSVYTFAIITGIAIPSYAFISLDQEYNKRLQLSKEFPAISLFVFKEGKSFESAFAYIVDTDTASAQRKASLACFNHKAVGIFSACEEVRTVSAQSLRAIEVKWRPGETPSSTNLYRNQEGQYQTSSCNHPVVADGYHIDCGETHYFINNREEAKKLADEINARLTYSGIGIMPESYKEFIVIRSVLESGPAHRAGLQTGDIITSLNGQSTQNWTTGQFSDTLRNSQSASADLTFQRGRETKSLSITKQSIVSGLGTFIENGSLPVEPTSAPTKPAVQPVAPIQPVFWRATDNLNLRSTPTLAAKIIATLQDGSCVKAEGKAQANFLQVSVVTANNQRATGYVSTNYLQSLPEGLMRDNTCRATLQ